MRHSCARGFGIEAPEAVTGFVHIGTPKGQPAGPRPRPDVDASHAGSRRDLRRPSPRRSASCRIAVSLRVVAFGVGLTLALLVGVLHRLRQP